LVVVLIVHYCNNKQMRVITATHRRIFKVETVNGSNRPLAIVGTRGAIGTKATQAIVTAANNESAVFRQRRKVDDDSESEVEYGLEGAAEIRAFVPAASAWIKTQKRW